MQATINPFHEMQILVTVVECGSFTAAALALDLPKSSVSRRLTGLEERLGIRLLHRTTRSLRLTTAGEMYYETASRLLRELEELETAVAGFSEEPRGLLRMTCPAGFGAANAELFARFARENPRVRLSIEETDRFVDLVAEGFDLAFRGGRAPDASLSGFQLLTSERVLVASPEYVERKGRPVKLKDLSEHDLLVLSARHKDTWALRSGKRQVKHELVAVLATNNLRTLQEAIEHGMGIGLLPLVNAGPAIEDGRLVHILPEWTASAATMWAIYPSGRGLASSLRAFLDLLKEWSFLCL